MAAVLFATLVFTSWVTAVAAGEGEAVQVVETEGNAAVRDQNQALARAEAIRDALQKAVAAVASRWLPPPPHSPAERALRERLLARAEVHILDFRILSESPAHDAYSLMVRATVSENGVRSALRRLGGVEPQGGAAATRVALRVVGVQTYRDYLRCQNVLLGQVPGVRRLTLREALWGVVRFDIDAEGATESLGMRLRETTAFEILHQDARLLEVYLR